MAAARVALSLFFVLVSLRVIPVDTALDMFEFNLVSVMFSMFEIACRYMA